MTMLIEVEGKQVNLWTPALEVHEFGTEESAERRARFVREALTWIGTPFADCADIKGPGGAVDCAMMMVRSAVDSGLVESFDPRPYSPSANMHRNEETFLAFLNKVGAVEVTEPRFGDIHVYRFGRIFYHGAIRISRAQILHAWNAAGCVMISRIEEPLLNFLTVSSQNVPRPVKYFDWWGG